MVHYVSQLFRFDKLCFKNFILVLYVLEIYRFHPFFNFLLEMLVFVLVQWNTPFGPSLHCSPVSGSIVDVRQEILYLLDPTVRDNGVLARKPHKESHCNFLVSIWVNWRVRVIFLFSPKITLATISPTYVFNGIVMWKILVFRWV